MKQNLEGLLSWFRYSPVYCSHRNTPNHALLTPLSSYLCEWLERRIGGTKGTNWGLIKEKSGNNNEVRKWTVTAIILRVHTEEVNGSQVTAHHAEPGYV